MIDWDALVVGPTTQAFGEPITYTPLYGRPIAITGVFDDAYLAEAMFEDGSSGVTEVSAVLGVQLSQFSVAPAQNDQVLVPRTGSTFVVRDMRNDSHGWAKLLLSRV
jgi:hypothetical protein